MKNLMILISGLLAGIAITLLIMFSWGPTMMFEEKESLYGFDETVTLLEESVKAHQWRIPTVHDMQKTMNSIGKEVLSAKIYELCKPEHAYEVISSDDGRKITSILPCRVAVYKKTNGKTYVSLMNLNVVGKMMKGNIPDVMEKVSGEIENIIAPLHK